MSSRQHTLQVIESVQSCLQFSTTSSQFMTSGKFRKLKPVTNSFLARSSIKKREKNSNPLFDQEYLDKVVDKLLQGKNRYRYKFLSKKSSIPLEPDKANPRENLVENWNHINETVLNLGVPEWADVVGGQLFAGGHLRSTTTTCLTLRLADNIVVMTDLELHQLIHSIYCWPGDAGESETLVRLISQLDGECARRSGTWSLSDNLSLSLLWARFAFGPETCQYASKVLETTSSKIHETCLDSLVSYLLLVSYLSHFAVRIDHSNENLRTLEKRVLSEFWNKLDQTEIAMVYSALNLLWQNAEESPSHLKKKIQDTYGFRL